MAIQNPSNLYTTGAVKLDSTPNVNLYGQLLAKRQAKNEAIDEYYRKLPSTLNTAGMRDQDRAGFDQQVADWQRHWMENRDKIRKGNNQEAFDNEKKFREIQTQLQESKNAAKTDLELGKMRFSKENSYVFDDPDFMNAQHQHALSVYDPNHKQMDLGSIIVPPRPLDTEAKNKIWANITNGIKPMGKVYDESKQVSNPVTGLVAVPYVKMYKPDQIQGIAENMGNLVKSDKSVYAHYNKLLDTLGEDEINKLQDAYSSVYKGKTLQGNGKTITVPDLMDTPEKLAKAETILRATIPQEEGEDYRPDVAAKRANSFEDWKKKNAITSAQALQRTLLNRSMATTGYNETTGNAFDEISDLQTSGGKKIVNGTVYNDDGSLYTSPNGDADIFIPKEKLPSSMITSLKAAGIPTIGDGVGIVVKNGVISAVETKRNGIISRQNMENYQKKFNTEPIKAAQPQFGKPLSKQSNQPTTNVPTYSKQDLLNSGKGWTEEKIKAAVKAGKIKVN